MSNSDITIRLGHDSGQLSAQAFVDSIKHTLTILNCVEAEMAMRESGSIQWMIRELSYSSPAQATLGAEQDTDIAAQVASASFDGIDELSRGKSQPRHFSDAAIEAASDLSKISDDGGYRLRFIRQGRTVEVAGPPRKSVAETNIQYFNSIGSIEGRLEAASVRNQPYLRVYDAVHDRGVKCYFSDPQLEQVRSGLGRRVIISGNVRSNRLGNPESMRVSKIEVRRRFCRTGDALGPQRIVEGRDRGHEGGTLHSRGTGGRVTTGESGRASEPCPASLGTGLQHCPASPVPARG